MNLVQVDGFNYHAHTAELQNYIFKPPFSSCYQYPQVELYWVYWETFSVEGQTVNMLGFVSHTVIVATTQVCYCSVKTA